MTYVPILILVVLLSATAIGCGGPQQTLSQTAQANALAGVELSLSAARDTAANVEGIFTLLRWNPAGCNCPDHEVRLYGHWTRCEIRGEEAPLATVQSFVKGADAGSPTSFLRVKGRLLEEAVYREGRAFCAFEISLVEEVFSIAKSSP